jgi:hypothetical protein
MDGGGNSRMIYSRMIMEREAEMERLENYSAVNDSAETGEDGRMILLMN